MKNSRLQKLLQKIIKLKLLQNKNNRAHLKLFFFSFRYFRVLTFFLLFVLLCLLPEAELRKIRSIECLRSFTKKNP